MIYDKLDLNKIVIGEANKFKDSDKYLYPIYYDDNDLVFTLKNKYYIVDGIKDNNFGKDSIDIKSKLVNDILESILKKLKIDYSSNGLQRLTINNDSVIKSDLPLDKLRNKKFKALVSIHVPTYYEDKEKFKKSLQTYVKELIVIEVIELEIEYDLEKLTLGE